MLALLVCMCAAGCRRDRPTLPPVSVPSGVDEADFVKTAESLRSPRYQHLYLGLGGVGVLIGPDGTSSDTVETTAPQPGIYPAEQWSGTSRVGGFHFSSTVTSGMPGSARTPPETTCFAQRLEIRRGVATTIHSQNMGQREVQSVVTSFVTPDGVLVTRFKDQLAEWRVRLHRQVALSSEGVPGSEGPEASTRGQVLAVTGRRDAAVCVLSREPAESPRTSTDTDETASAIVPLTEDASTLTAFVATCVGRDEGARAEAERRATAAQQTGFDALQQQTEAWWEGFWDASSVDIPEKSLAHWYRRSLYYLAAMTAGADSPPGPMGPLRVRWGGRIFAHDLTYMHYALLTSNHVEESGGITRWYHKVLPAAKANAKERYQSIGPARYGWEQNAEGKEAAGQPFSEAHHVNGEVALQAVMQALWGDPDDEEAMAQAREILQATTRFLCEHMQWDDELQSHVSPESTDLDENARLIRGGVSTQMATKWCLEASRELGVPAWPARVHVPTAQWKGREVVVVHAGDSPERQIKHPAPLVGVWWWPVLDPGSELVKNTYTNVLSRIDLDHTPTFNRPWLAAVAARMGRGDESLRLLRDLLQAEGAIVDDTCFAEGQGNRWTYFLTTCGALVSAVNEMLLQSYEPNTIRVLPALPVTWQDKSVGFDRLRARGGRGRCGHRMR